MIGINIKNNIKEFTKELTRAERQAIPTATRNAVNDTARKVLRAEVAALGRYLDRPNPFTKRAYRVKTANKQNLTAGVYTMPAQQKYLSLQVYGGSSQNFWPVAGAKAKRNQYGNISRKATTGKNVSIITLNGGMKAALKTTGKGKRKKSVVVGIYPKRRTYRPRLPFHRIAHDVAARRFKKEFAKSLGITMRRMAL